MPAEADNRTVRTLAPMLAVAVALAVATTAAAAAAERP